MRHPFEGPPPDRRDLEIQRLRDQLERARQREGRIRAEERERFPLLSAASKRFADSMRSGMDERQQRRLDAQHAVSHMLEDFGDLLEAAPGIFRVLGERLGWDVGVLWMVEGDALRCGGTWRAAGWDPNGFEEACRESLFNPGAGLPGRVWRREEACWVEDLLEDDGFLRKEAAEEAGLRCALAFPVQDGGGVVGVFEFLKSEVSPVDEELVQVAYLVGHQLGQFVERRRAEEERDRALAREREARQGIGAILESINDAFFTVDDDWRFTYVNRQAEEMWNRRREELLGKVVWEEFPSAVGSEAHGAMLRAAQTGETVGYEAFSPMLNAWVSGRAYPSPQGVSVYFQDVTEIMEARKDIEDRERRYRTLATNIPGAVFRCVHRDGTPTMEFVSGRIEEITGYPAEDFIADRKRSYVDVIHPEDRGKNSRRVWRALERGASYNIEYRILHRGGEVRWVNERGSGIFSEDGGLLWVDGAIFDINARKRAEETLRKSTGRAAFRTELAEALRPLADPADIKAEASRVLGEHLGVNRVIYGEISPDDLSYVGGSEYLDGAGSIAGRLDLDDFDPGLLENFRAGRTVVAPDLSNDAALTADRLAAFEAAQVRAHVSVPLVKDGRLVAALGVNQAQPRAWTAEEVALVEETAERTWAAVERARAEEALRRSEERYRTLFERIDEGFCILEMMFDEAGRPIDYRFLETNPAFERMTGLRQPTGKRARELVPDLEDWWIETYGKVALTGEAIHFENGSEAMGRWFEVHASRIGRHRSSKVALVFDDITDRKRAAEERDRQLAREWVAHAEAAERERISRELHDRVAHSMAVAHQSLQLHEVLARTDAQRAESKLDLAREMIKASLESTRNLSAELRRLDAEEDLEAELRHLLDVAVPPGIRADIRVDGNEAGVPGHVRGQLFLMLREAVRNAVTHSGCGSLSVGLDIAPERVVGRVEDDGHGFDDDAGNGGVGLRSMRERAALLDGDLKLDCEPGRGTRVELSVPLAGGR